ncbi:MAG TPA: winged helix-turn-helix transcriptional regulator [Bauldia sp.]|nr:winged helix-turn-helix transcriptional regulator [Bauldia sp.]
MSRTARRYDQFCPVADALDIVGERWALLVVRELLLGPKRFVDLEAGLPGAGTNTLTTRLNELERGGVIVRRRLPPPSATMVYELTEWGRGLEPIVYAIARWAAPRLGSQQPRYPIRATWLGVALTAFYRREAAKALSAVVEITMPTGALTLDFHRGALTVRETTAERATLRITASEDDMLALFGAAPPGHRRKPRLKTEGDTALIDRLVAIFPLGGGEAQRPETP